MRILVTGYKGLVGSHVYKSLRSDHEVLGLEKHETLSKWIEQLKFRTSWNFVYDAIVHIGAISSNQYQDADIFMWNALATKLLAERVTKPDRRIPYFIYFSSSIVRATEKQLDDRTFYGWSKYMGEHYVMDTYERCDSKNWCILCPTVIWGDEKGFPGQKSIPYRLANHTLEYLLEDYSRDYVHVDDVVSAVRYCLEHRVNGTYDLRSGKDTSNQEIATYSDWKGYQMIDDPSEMGYNQVTRHVKPNNPTLPGWGAEVDLAEAIQQLEREYQKRGQY